MACSDESGRRRALHGPAPACSPSTRCALAPATANGVGGVAVDEIITMVNIALGAISVAQCSSGDANHDNAITIDEIVTAVNAALNGCGDEACPARTRSSSGTYGSMAANCAGSRR